MIALANHTANSFFSDIPSAAVPAAQCAWDGITSTRAVVGDAFYISFCQKLQVRDIEPPARAEFIEWSRRIRAGEVNRPKDVSDALPTSAAHRSAVDRAMKAYEIIKKAVELQRAKIDGGHNPDSQMVDVIVAEAIKEWLTSEADDWSAAMHLDYTPGEIAMQLLITKDGGQNAKLLDLFATHMQRELAFAIVAGRRTEGGEA